MTDWPAIVRAHGPLAARTAYRILGHAADAEDAVQQAFADALRVQRNGSVIDWPALLRHLTARRALDLLRRRTKNAQPIAHDPPALSSSHPEALAVAAERGTLLRQALAQLPEREAQVFSLRYFADLSNPEIASALHIRVGAVAVALHKARVRLEQLMQE